jgi:DNA-binding MarR family transcriptional regulator
VAAIELRAAAGLPSRARSAKIAYRQERRRAWTMAKRPTQKAKSKESDDSDAELNLENLVGYNLRRAHAVQRQRFAAVFGPEGIRPVLLSALGLIYEKPNLKQSALGKLLDVKRANVVPMLNELEQRGLIERRRSAHDRRAHEIELTPEGREKTRRWLQLHARLEEDLVKGLGAREREELLALLKKIRRLSTNPKLGR